MPFGHKHFLLLGTQHCVLPGSNWTPLWFIFVKLLQNNRHGAGAMHDIVSLRALRLLSRDGN